MISVFEVFALNRNEQDFIENLELYGTIIMEQQEEKDRSESIEPEEDLSDPRVKTLFDFKGQITEEEYQWAKQQVAENNKKVIMVVEVYHKMKDGTDFVHSIKRIFNMSKK
jgi:hypothetical protein